MLDVRGFDRLEQCVDPPTVEKQDLDASPIMSIAVSGEREERELYVLADRYVKSVDEVVKTKEQELLTL